MKMSLAKQNYKWVIILLFLGLIIIPAQIPSPTIKNAVVAVLGGGCLLFELLSLKSLNRNEENFKKNNQQTILLIVLTILLLVVNFFV